MGLLLSPKDVGSQPPPQTHTLLNRADIHVAFVLWDDESLPEDPPYEHKKGGSFFGLF